jgi:hypothetical protein
MGVLSMSPALPKEIIDEICLYLPLEKSLYISEYATLKRMGQAKDTFLNTLLVQKETTDAYFYFKSHFPCEYTLFHLTHCMFNDHYVIFYDILKSKEWSEIEKMNILQYIIFTNKVKFLNITIGVYGKNMVINVMNTSDGIYDLIARKDCLFLLDFMYQNKRMIQNYENHINFMLNEAVAFSSFKIIKFCFEKELENCELKEESIVRFMLRYDNAKIFKYIIHNFQPEITWRLRRRCALHGTLKMNKIIKNNN